MTLVKQPLQQPSPSLNETWPVIFEYVPGSFVRWLRGGPTRAVVPATRPREARSHSRRDCSPPSGDDGDSEPPPDLALLDRFNADLSFLPASLRARLFLALPEHVQRPYWDDLARRLEER